MFVIDGLGTATPKHSIRQGDAAEIAKSLYRGNGSSGSHDLGDRVRALYSKAGVQTRHSVLLHSSTHGHSARQTFYAPARSANDAGPSTEARMRQYELAAGPLAIEAAHSALSNGNYQPRDITHLITVSCSGFSAPGIDLAIIRELGMSPATQRTHIGFMGCHGAMNGLRVAQAFSASDPAARVLVVAVELCSLHHQYCERADQIVANALFADGAAAVVGREAPSITESRHWHLKALGSAIIPETTDYLQWHIRDHGFEMALSPRLPVTIKQTIRPWLENWLRENDWPLEHVRSWAIHPGGPKVLEACAEALGLSPGDLWASEEVLGEYGNMSSPTVLFILDRLRSRNADSPCVMLAFGPGLAVEAALWVSGIGQS